MKIIWVRGSEKITTKRPATDFICSPVRGGGKSSLLEHRAEAYLRNGNTVVDFFGCYCEETEVETSNGWKRFKDVSNKDEIKTLNMYDEHEYHHPYAIQEYDYKGEMVHIGNPDTQFDLLVTPDHRLLLESIHGLRCIRRAYEILNEANKPEKYTNWRLLRETEDGLMKTPLRTEDLKTEQYSGKIYDVSVPNHTLHVRRTTEPVWCGNSRDGEGLAWCRNPSVVSGEKKLALIHSDNVSVSSSYDQIPINSLKQRHLEKYDILVSASPIHRNLSDEYRNINYITDLLYDRGVAGWKKIVVGVVREASSLYYSRISVDRNQSTAKAYMIYLIREARHMGLALEMDTLKFTSIDLDIRILCDYTYFKGQGYLGLPDDLKFLYGFFKPSFVRNMKPYEFIILSRKGSVGLGIFPEVKWHKQERENLLKLLDITVEPNEGMVESSNLGHYKTVGDKQHLAMIEAVAPKRLRNKYELDVEKKSYRTIAKELGHSPSTVTMHVAKHDSAVEQHGYCPICRRAGGVLFEERIKGGSTA